jgi:hypothetical protein
LEEPEDELQTGSQTGPQIGPVTQD